MTTFLAFDIGIKNLAWCCFQVSGDKYTILGWDNYNLLSDESNVGGSTKKGGKCAHCSVKAAYEGQGIQTCVRHCVPGLPALRDLSGNLLKKVPAGKLVKELLVSKGVAKPPTKKADLDAELAKIYSLPILTKKVSKAPDVGLSEIHDSIKKLVTKQKALWSSCNLILLENQPVFKNPTMKSVQILLFATLRDLLQQPPPSLKLVHAGKKVKGATTGDAGYKDRKAGSEARVETFLKNPKLSSPEVWTKVWTSATKKSDLADALSMCLDAALPQSA
jgi:hypothetical protein